MSPPRVGELFAGIGGFGLAAQRVGCEVVWAVEIDPFARAVYDERFHGHILGRDVRDFPSGSDDSVYAVDCITAGFPCQDLSVAGKRKGLIGERSGLFWEIIRVAKRLRPRWLLLENVPGLLSSHRGRDFETVLAALDELGYGVAWRVLDAQFFGVPQRRRRVFIVGHLGGPCPPEVLFEPEGVSGDSAARREAGAGVTEDVARCLDAGEWRGPNRNQVGNVIARPITATSYKGHDEDTDTIVAHTLRAEGADASEDGTGRGTPLVIQEAQTGCRLYETAGTLRSDALGSQPGGSLLLAPTLRVGGREQGAGSSSDNTPRVAAPLTQSFAKHHGASGGKDSYPHNLVNETRPRRLTPRECERLQGFPDDWTLIEGASDSARYRALGNAVAVPVVEWILRRLVEVAC